MKQKNKNVYSTNEIVLLIGMVAGLDPEDYSDSELKAMIYKCKASCSNGYSNVIQR